jgi:hypothetical protein
MGQPEGLISKVMFLAISIWFWAIIVALALTVVHLALSPTL